MELWIKMNVINKQGNLIAYKNFYRLQKMANKKAFSKKTKSLLHLLTISRIPIHWDVLQKKSLHGRFM